MEQQVTEKGAAAGTVDGDLAIVDVHLDRTEKAIAHAVSRGADDREIERHEHSERIAAVVPR